MVAMFAQVIRENWNLKYSACFVICPLPKESPATDRVPETVSVVARLKAAPTNRILVQNRPESRTDDKELLAVCVKPLHYDYNRVRGIVKASRRRTSKLTRIVMVVLVFLLVPRGR